MLDIRITTRSKMIDLDNFKIEEVDIDDVAHSLSNQCRYNGNTPVFYSVGEHASYVARLCKLYILNNEAPFIEQWHYDDKAMCCQGALHHDDPEQISGDCIRPIKRKITGFREIEQTVQPVMERAFGLVLTDEMHQLIKKADDTLADLEIRYFFPWKVMGKQTNDFRLTDFSGAHLPGLSPKRAKKLYMDTFKKLSAGNWLDI